jgi:hypothetical protein
MSSLHCFNQMINFMLSDSILFWNMKKLFTAKIPYMVVNSCKGIEAFYIDTENIW